MEYEIYPTGKEPKCEVTNLRESSDGSFCAILLITPAFMAIKTEGE